jgi:hypothetical protein
MQSCKAARLRVRRSLFAANPAKHSTDQYAAWYHCKFHDEVKSAEVAIWVIVDPTFSSAAVRPQALATVQAADSPDTISILSFLTHIAGCGG